MQILPTTREFYISMNIIMWSTDFVLCLRVASTMVTAWLSTCMAEICMSQQLLSLVPADQLEKSHKAPGASLLQLLLPVAVAW